MVIPYVRRARILSLCTVYEVLTEDYVYTLSAFCVGKLLDSQAKEDNIDSISSTLLNIWSINKLVQKILEIIPSIKKQLIKLPSIH